MSDTTFAFVLFVILGATMFFLLHVITKEMTAMKERIDGLANYCTLLEKQIKMQREKNIPGIKSKKK
jgi:hypothetical protein